MDPNSAADISTDEKPRIRNSQACLECRKAKIKCNGKRKDAQNCSRCEAKGLDCNWTQSRRGKKPGTKNLATRAREQNEALQRQLGQQLQTGGDTTRSAGVSSPNPIYRATEHSGALRHVGWDHLHGSQARPVSASSSEHDHIMSLQRHGSDASSHMSPQSAITPSSASSGQSSSVPTTISANEPRHSYNGQYPHYSGGGSSGSMQGHNHASSSSSSSSRRTSKYHDGLLIRESRMPPSSTNPLLCLSEAALGKRCTESDSEDELAQDNEGTEDAIATPAQGSPMRPESRKRSSNFGGGHGVDGRDTEDGDGEDVEAKSARAISEMLETSGWSRSCLAQAACERASYFSGASASASWDTRRCDPIDRGFVTMQEAERLFDIFMDTVQEQFSCLDPVLHNMQTIKASSNFLFSVILAIGASIDRSPRSVQQFEHLRALVDSLIVELLSRNVKSVEVVKGLIVWPMWAHLTPLMADDRAWLLIGTAARMAKELDLSMREDTPQQDEMARRRARDRSRTWAMTAIMERSFSSFSGQRPNTTLDVEWSSLNDWLKSPINLDGDVQIVAFLHLRRIEEITRSRIFSQNYYEVGSIESNRVSANVLFEAWQEAWCEHPALSKHPLTSTIMRVIGLHIQVLINTHAIRESDRRRAICEASNMRILRVCSTASKSARDQCVSLLTDACQLAIDKLHGHAHTISRIVAAMLGWSGVHLLKNGPIETRELVVRLGLMLAGDSRDATHARSFARFYGRFILSLSAELVERDRAEKLRRKRQRLRGSSHASTSSPGAGVSGAGTSGMLPGFAALVASPRSEGTDMMRSLTGITNGSGPEFKHAPTSSSISGAPMSDMAMAFESAASNGLQTPGAASRATGGIQAVFSHPMSASSSASVSAMPYGHSNGGGFAAAPTMMSSMAPPQAGFKSEVSNAAVGPGHGNGNGISMAAPPASSSTGFDSVTNTWLGTDDLLDQYMQSILPIFNDFDHSNNSNSLAAGIGTGGGVGVAMPDIGR